jgi:hypothetical protein
MGYDRLNAHTFADREEEEITGELVLSMKEALEARNAPRWAKNFWVAEETRVNDGKRSGKRRFRIDIEIIQSQPGMRPQFAFEAKRLHDGASRTAYLGREGLECFVDGRYVKGAEICGMLGYVQAESIDTHAKALGQSMAHDPERFAVAEQWSSCPIANDLVTYMSLHRRPKPLSSITVLHSFLKFY